MEFTAKKYKNIKVILSIFEAIAFLIIFIKVKLLYNSSISSSLTSFSSSFKNSSVSFDFLIN